MSLMTAWYNKQEGPVQPLSMNPHKFMLWVFIVSIVMFYAGLTSVFIIKRTEDYFQQLYIPNLFWINTGVLLLSSVTIHLAYVFAKRNDLARVKSMLGLTTVLGVSFLVLQFYAWKDLVANSVYFTGGPALDTLYYIFSGMHGLHLISGIIFLLYTLNKAIKLQINPERMTTMENCMVYWHFLDGLWLYLFVFLLLNR